MEMNVDHRIKSAWDGLYLPLPFTRQHSAQTLIAYLQGVVDFAPEYWWEMNDSGRRRVLRHLQKEGFVNKCVDFHKGGVRFMGSEPFLTGMTKSMSPIETGSFGKPLHEGPNGGKRMLPSAYATLTDHWLRANGVVVHPGFMDQSHLRNSLNLLKESHSNHLGGASNCLGIIARHFRNCPRIVELAIEMLKELERVDVEEMYPIWKVLAQYVKDPEPAKSQLTVEVDIDTSRAMSKLEDLERRLTSFENNFHPHRGGGQR